MQNTPMKKNEDKLKRKPRFHETFIQGFLFLCGLVSILVTVGIVYELGKEAMLFFTKTQWEEPNKEALRDFGETDTSFMTTTGGSDIVPETVIRIDEEEMLVKSVEGVTLNVVRGYNETIPSGHEEGRTIYTARNVTLFEFLTKTEWNPQIGKFGIWALVMATLITSLIALLVALPIGLSIAIYLSEYASDKVRNTLKPILEILAGVPTVVYGYFALTMMTPLLRMIFGQDTVEIYNTASAGIVIGILIIPLVSSMSEDALHAVPRSLREAAFGLGATKLETAIKVVVPAAISGIAAAFIVAASRAVGETMIVALAAGAGSKFTLNPFEGAETMTGHIVRISGGDLSYNSIDYNSLFAIGLLLFFMTLGLNIFSQYIVNRFREEYE
jgi:phosphate transport system permease protein